MIALICLQSFYRRYVIRLCVAGMLCFGLAPQALAQPVATAAPQQAQLLNSERIAQRFGSYAITVLESDETIRVSNLYSTSGDEKTCRTFAIVRYPERIDPLFAAEHRLIVNGGSIGAVFAAHGWAVEKTNRYIGEVAASAKLATLMRTPAGTPLAVHIYVFAVVKAGASFDYATIVEVHHPDYLKVQNLQSIYGPLSAGEIDPATKEILRIANDRMR